MTVLLRKQPAWRVNRAYGTRRDDPEPRLDEILDDPILQLLMARDGVDRRSLGRIVHGARRRLGLEGPSPAVADAILFAECSAGGRASTGS
jgi:hypothetical protein